MSQLQNKIRLIIESKNISEKEIIDELNSQEVTRLVPTIVFLSLIIIVGIPGNGLVCYIYRSNHSASSSSWFIFFLAVMDLILCVLIVPLEIATICFQYNFESGPLCKLSTLVSLCSLLSLGFTLLLVSINRYRKVCRPHGWQIDFKKARNLSVVAVSVGFVLSLPIVFVYGIYEFDINVGEFNVTFYECSFRKTAKESSFPFYYLLCGMTIFTASLATMCIVYVFIGKAIKKHTFGGNIKGSVSPSSSMSKRRQVISSNSNTIELKMARICDGIQLTGDSTCNGTAEISVSQSGEEQTCEFEKPALHVLKAKPKDRKKTKSRAKARKATLSMFLISLGFVLSYLPLLCLSLVKSLVHDFIETLSDDERAAYVFFLRFCFLSGAINPFIYGIADSNFRGNCKNVIRQIYDRVLKCFGCRR